MKLSQSYLEYLIKEEIQTTDLITERAAPTMQQVLAGKASLRSGMRGAAVTQLQQALCKAGNKTMCGKLPDRYGPKTIKAVRAFQKQAKIKVDGIVGTGTAGKLMGGAPGAAAAPAAPAAPEKPFGSQVLRRDLQMLSSQLGKLSYINDEDMLKIHNIIKKYSRSPQLLAALKDTYRDATGDDLAQKITNISGVEKWKKPTLAMLGVKYEKDITTRAGELTSKTGAVAGALPMNVFKTIQSGFTRMAGELVGTDLHVRGFLNFLGWRDNPWTGADLTGAERKFIKNFLTNLVNGGYERKGSGLSPKIRNRLRQQRKRWEKTGKFSFGNEKLGGTEKSNAAYKVYQSQMPAGEFAARAYGGTRKRKHMPVDVSMAGQMEKFLGQFSFTGSPEDGFSISDHYDFNDFNKAKNDKQIQRIVKKRIAGLGSAISDANKYTIARNLGPLWMHYTKFKGYPVKIDV